MSLTDETTAGLARFLSDDWGCEVTVDNLSMASAGARRRNVLFDARRDDSEVLHLVATIIPASGMQLMEIDVEASNLQLAEAAGMPVPHVHAVCTDPSFVGGPFFVTARIDGETVPRQILRLVDATPGLGPLLARQCGEALARLHSVDQDRAHANLVRPGAETPAAFALARLEVPIGMLLQPSPAFQLSYNWLARNQPDPPPRLAVVHSDCRNGNIIVGPDGLRAVLDWEGCHVGDPMADLSWMCVRMWRFRNDDLEVGGFADRSDLRTGYEAAGGTWDDDSFHWWKTLGTLRWGLGLAGQAMAHLEGAFRSIVMAASGRRVAELEYDTLMLLSGVYGTR